MPLGPGSTAARRARNRRILDGLAHLVADGIRNEAETGEVDLASLANLLAASGEPEDEIAGEFHRNVMELLDDVPWVPVENVDGSQRGALPSRCVRLAAEPRPKVSATFPPVYVQDRVKAALPDPQTHRRGDDTHRQSATRRNAYDYWSLVADLCRPGDAPLWSSDEADARFLALLDLLEALDVEDRSKTEALLEGLRGDPASRLLPSAGPEGGRVMLPVPNPAEGVRGRRSRLVMARARATSAEALDPPSELDLAFLPDGLLDNETAVDRAKPLGVRPFTVDNVLDRLNGISSFQVDGPRLLSFLWMLLNRERLSSYGTANSAKQADEFDPSRWFWCQPGRADDETKRLSQQRERYLADVPVPCRDGKWRAAGTVAFGQDWAEWLEAGEAGDPTAAGQTRIEAYRAMERVGPGDASFLASPETLTSLLPPAAPEPTVTGDGGEQY